MDEKVYVRESTIPVEKTSKTHPWSKIIHVRKDKRNSWAECVGRRVMEMDLQGEGRRVRSKLTRMDNISPDFRKGNLAEETCSWDYLFAQIQGYSSRFPFSKIFISVLGAKRQEIRS